MSRDWTEVVFNARPARQLLLSAVSSRLSARLSVTVRHVVVTVKFQHKQIYDNMVFTER